VPFGYWIVRAAAPSLLVELGTHTGVSYSAFCESIKRSGLPTLAYAVDIWRGDPHSGEYEEEVYLQFRDFHDERYGAFSQLLRCTFDDALGMFADRSIDLLHIDGFHTYEAVAHDFDNWAPKLSNCGIVLFQGGAIRAQGFST